VDQKSPSEVSVLAIASGGGHWVQLQRLRKAWEGCQTTYVTTLEGYRTDIEKDCKERGLEFPEFYTVTDANKDKKLLLLKQLFQIIWILLKTKPDVVVSTGAAPGFFALKIAKLMGKKTIWVDSIANAEELSLAGRKAGSCADIWLTQWPELEGCMNAEKKLPKYKGAVV
jgi:UDP-N-acetylglucosamine:LPS N-acetylglucosamine transferase